LRCVCCNNLLSDYEATRRNIETNTFVDMCNECFSTVDGDMKTIDRLDLKHDDATRFADDDDWHDICSSYK